MRFASAKQLAAMLAPYVGDAAHIIPDPTRNVLVVTGPALARQSVIELVRVFDVDYLAGQSYALFPVKSGEPDKIATDLEHALQIDADGPLAGVIKVVPILQANAIMVIAQQPAYLDRAAHLIAQLDVVADEAGRNVYVYNLRNTEAADIQPVIQTAFNPAHAGNAENAGAGAGGLPPTSTPAQVSAPGAAPNAAANAPLAAQASTGGTTTPTPAMASLILSGTQSPASSGSPTTAQAASVAAAPGAPQIIADVKGNSLIIVATQAEYEKIAAALRQLDVLPAQVLVEATIAEVTLNKALQYGTQFFFNNAEATATLSNAQSVTPTTINPAAPLSSAALFSPALAPSFPGLAVTRLAGSQQYAIQALQSVTDVHVISAPKISHSQPAAGEHSSRLARPIITQSATAVGTAGAPVVNSVAYQPTGIILNVTPQIGTGGMVSLDIDQEVSDVVATTSSTINSPTFTEQRFKSEVVVQDGETIGLAGLISDNKSVGNSGIPFLREIPVLGALFSTQNNTDVRTELLVLDHPASRTRRSRGTRHHGRTEAQTGAPRCSGAMTPRRHRVASDAGIGTTFSDRQSRARGFALFIVLWFLVLIAAIGTYVLANARSETALARNILAGAHAEALADSGIAQVVFNLTDTDPTKQWALDGTAYRVLLSDGAVTIRLGDETEKINPNLASRPLMAALFEALGIVPSDAAQLAASIVDWTHPLPRTADPNDDRKPYQAAGLDYGPPHRPIPSSGRTELRPWHDAGDFALGAALSLALYRRRSAGPAQRAGNHSARARHRGGRHDPRHLASEWRGVARQHQQRGRSAGRAIDRRCRGDRP